MKFFLDIDGVMVHANPHKSVELEGDGFYRFNSIAVEILKSVVSKSKDEIILSTSHRHRFNIDEWKEIFETRGISAKSISIIEIKHHPKINRKTEIVNWIFENHIGSEELVIIDDDKSLNELPKYLKNRLVLTNSYFGLNDETDLKKVVKPYKKLQVEIKKLEKKLEKMKDEEDYSEFKYFTLKDY